MFIRRMAILGALAMVVALSTEVQAQSGPPTVPLIGARLFTPPLGLFVDVDSSGRDPLRFSCRLLNVGTKDRVVRIQIVSAASGTVLEDSGNLPLAAGQATALFIRGNTGSDPSFYCKFNRSGPKNDYRGVAAINEEMSYSSAFAARDIVAVPAQ